MANTVLLKKSSVASKVPLVTDLVYGETAINYTDGKLYYKTAGNTIDYFPSATSTATLTNKTLTSPTITSPTLSGGTINNTSIGQSTAAAGSFTTLSASGLSTFTGEVLINNSSGAGGSSEGGELHFAIPTANSTLSGPIAIDVYQNKVRIFETTGTNRGVYIDLTAASTNAGTNLLAGGGGTGMPSTYTGYDEYGVGGISTSTTVYAFSTATYRSAKYFITVTSGTNYGVYEFMVTHDGTTVYFSGNNNDYVTSGTSVTYFAGDYVESLLDENTRIEVGTMHHSFNWAISGGNLVFSAASTSGTISVKGTVTLIKV